MALSHRIIPHFALAIAIILAGCTETTYISPTVPDEFDKNIVGGWSLIASDSLFEGDLFITIDGTATEYSVFGSEFRTNDYDFREMDYILIDDELQFMDRLYKRADNANPVESPCEYFPDEGLIKLFRVNESYAFCVRIGYDNDREVFFEHRSIWSPQFGCERDTIIYSVTWDKILCSHDKYNPIPWWREFWVFDIDVNDWGPEPLLERVHIVRDTTLSIGPLSKVDIIQYNWFGSFENQILLEELEFYTLSVAYFAPELGVVIYEYINYGSYASNNKYFRSELVSYINPQKTVKAELARRDFRHVLRHELE